MIEKKKRIIYISKLWAILLLEADLNELYKIIFSCHLLSSLEHGNKISYEIIEGTRDQSAYHIA